MIYSAPDSVNLEYTSSWLKYQLLFRIMIYTKQQSYECIYGHFQIIKQCEVNETNVITYEIIASDTIISSMNWLNSPFIA